MNATGYRWDVMSHWTPVQFEVWLMKQSRESLQQFLQNTDPNGCWTDRLFQIEYNGDPGPLSLADVRQSVREFWAEC